MGAGMSMLPPATASGPLAPTASHERRECKDIEDEKDAYLASGGKSSDTDEPESSSHTIEPMPILQPIISRPVDPAAPGAVIPTKRPLTTFHLIVVAALVTFTLCMSAAGAMTLTIALPTIQKELNMDEHDLQWITAAYGLTNGCFLLLSGRLADVHGRKLVFLVSDCPLMCHEISADYVADRTHLGGYLDFGRWIHERRSCTRRHKSPRR